MEGTIRATRARYLLGFTVTDELSLAVSARTSGGDGPFSAIRNPAGMRAGFSVLPGWGQGAYSLP